ncbi:MAG: ATP-binding protein, partial [bacterium]|nr:ATP-binding protein [bacterium]
TRSLTAELEFSQRLLDTAGVLIVVLDQNGHVLRINKFAEELTRLSREEAERVFTSFVYHHESPLSRIFDPRSPEEITSLATELPLRDGTKRFISWSTRNLPARPGQGARLIVGIDVSEQKQLEWKLKSYNVQLENMIETSSHELRQTNAQLIHAARLASLGEVAAGIAHEMKQPLNVISITADLIRLLHRNRTLSDDLLLSNLEKIRRTVDRMATTINHLRGFTRIDSANFEPVRVTDAMDGALSILGEQIRLDAIDIFREAPDDLPLIYGELHQIEQVLVNLMQNARHAIEERVTAAETKGDAKIPIPKHITLRAGMRHAGREVFVEVVDTGVGMERDVLDRVFEPFYTTKQADRGTGLGLSISMNIIQSHGGTIEVESSPGVGSVFRVIFPAETAA